MSDRGSLIASRRVTEDTADTFAVLTQVVREADQALETAGGGSRHWLRDYFLPTLEAYGLAVVDVAKHITHGRHCTCTPCRVEDWTNPKLAPCGMHGADCPPVYAPLGCAGDRING